MPRGVRMVRDRVFLFARGAHTVAVMTFRLFRRRRPVLKDLLENGVSVAVFPGRPACTS
jgi:hypothetical protein